MVQLQLLYISGTCKASVRKLFASRSRDYNNRIYIDSLTKLRCFTNTVSVYCTDGIFSWLTSSNFCLLFVVVKPNLSHCRDILTTLFVMLKSYSHKFSTQEAKQLGDWDLRIFFLLYTSYQISWMPCLISNKNINVRTNSK